MRQFTFLVTSLTICTLASNLSAADDEKAPDAARRFIVTVEKIDPKEPGGVEVEYLKDGMKITVIKSGASVFGLTFSNSCELKLLKKDKSLLATKDGVTATDANGDKWKSQKVTLNDKQVFAFFKKD